MLHRQTRSCYFFYRNSDWIVVKQLIDVRGWRQLRILIGKARYFKNMADDLSPLVETILASDFPSIQL